MITREMIREALQENMSMEFEGNNATYYLHITEDGKIVSSHNQADSSFTAILDKAAYRDFPADYDWRDDVEVESNPYFEKVVDTLYKEAQEYLA